MVVAVFGTTGEAIKLAPVLAELHRRNAAYVVCTGQQVQQIPELLRDFGLPAPHLWIGRGARGRDLERPRDIPPWLASVGANVGRHGRRLRRVATDGPTRPLVLVHGDTFTTVIGAMLGRLLRVPVAHVEAGLRSGDWRNPFPEELDRRAASLLAGIHYAPGAWAADNLRRSRPHVGEILDTGGNTIADAIAMVPAGNPALDVPPGPFGLVSIHRFELLSRPALLRSLLERLRDASRATPLLFIDHPVTMAAIAANGLDRLFDQHFRRVPRLRYFPFIRLLKASGFLVTDSGGSQEECAYLGHPCLVHRATTERLDGLDAGSVVLSRLDDAQVQRFLDDPLAHARSPSQAVRRATDVILRDLVTRGAVPPA